MAIDLFNGEVVGHAMATHMRAELVCDAVELANRRGTACWNEVLPPSICPPDCRT